MLLARLQSRRVRPLTKRLTPRQLLQHAPRRQLSSLRIIDFGIRPAHILVDRIGEHALRDLVRRVDASVRAEAAWVVKRWVVRITGYASLHGGVEDAGSPAIDLESQ